MTSTELRYLYKTMLPTAKESSKQTREKEKQVTKRYSPKGRPTGSLILYYNTIFSGLHIICFIVSAGVEDSAKKKEKANGSSSSSNKKEVGTQSNLPYSHLKSTGTDFEG
uniref:Uncharacterized protein n=1 Tax=Glossina brevipalpis TaxID=37001 RepID=A0A1A9X140_9MUSC